jgi:hypothetical protein
VQPLDIDKRRQDDGRLSDIEPLFICQVCGQRGADVRPNFDWEIEARPASKVDHAALGVRLFNLKYFEVPTPLLTCIKC